MARPTVDDAQRRARVAWRHRLAANPQPDPTALTRELVALHATDPATVYLSVAARSGLADPAATDRALYDDRTLVRTLAMRRTMFVVPVDTLAAVRAACTEEIAARERRTTRKLLGENGIADPDSWLVDTETETLAALAARGGEATAAELADDVPALRTTLVYAPGKPYEGRSRAVSRVLHQLAAEGRVIRGRPLSSWVSNYRWALAERWLPPAAPPPAKEAEADLVRSWLATFGPGTLADLKWWTGWPVARTRRALTAVGAVEVTLGGGDAGFVLPDDLDPVPDPPPAATLLPSLDPTVMGWAMAGRDWYLDPAHKPAMYDRSGNLGPTVWWGARVVGGWAQRPDGTVAHRLFVDIGRDGATAAAEAATALQEWLGEVRVTPRFRTPLERELATT